LNDLERLGAAELQAVLDFYRGGGGVLVVLGDRADPGFWNSAVLGELGAGRLGGLDQAPTGSAWRLMRATAGHPVLTGFPAGPGAWRIEDEQGREIPSELAAERGATRLRSDPLEHPGLYRVMQGGTMRSTFAVNPDPRESDLTPVPERAMVRAFPPGRAQVVRPGENLARRVREARYGRELWSWFIVMALVLLAAETVIGRWGLGSRVPEAVGAGAR